MTIKLIPDIVVIPEGSFLMGSENGPENEMPRHRVRLDGFAIGKFPVINREYKIFVDETHVQAPPFWSDPMFSDPEQPVVGVTWHDAAAYCQWLRERTGQGFRLPTEAEWERACRGLTEKAVYPWGDRNPSKEDAKFNGIDGPSPVGKCKASYFGLYDIVGNVWEWCSDWFHTAFTAAKQHNPTGPATGQTKVMKGGSFLCHASYCNRYRVAARTSNTPDSATSNIGFLCVQPIP